MFLTIIEICKVSADSGKQTIVVCLLPIALSKLPSWSWQNVFAHSNVLMARTFIQEGVGSQKLDHCEEKS